MTSRCSGKRQDLRQLQSASRLSGLPPILTADQLAEHLRLGPANLLRIRHEAFPNAHWRIGKHVRFWRDRLLIEPCIKQGNSRHTPFLTREEVDSAFAHALWAERYPAVLTLRNAAELVQLPESTIRDWRSRQLLRPCSVNVGRQVRIYRNEYLQLLFKGLNSE
jgi:hypothetical protein